MRYRLRTLLTWLAKYDVIRVQVTLVLGFFGLMAAYGCWLECEFSGWPTVLRPLAITLGVVSVAAIAEGVWKLDC